MEETNSENVFHFEDDLFETKERVAVLRDIPTFQPRSYFPSDEKYDEKSLSYLKCNPKLFKYHADYLYSKGKYEEAMEAYLHLETLYKDNTYMKRNVIESTVWCLIKKKSISEAQNIAQKLLEDATTFEQQMGSQYLLNIITGKVEDSSTILHRVQKQADGKNVMAHLTEYSKAESSKHDN